MHGNDMAEKHILLWLQSNFIPLTELYQARLWPAKGCEIHLPGDSANPTSVVDRNYSLLLQIGA